MKIELEEHEIKEAILDYISTTGFALQGDVGEIEMKNSRGDFGVTATISIVKNQASTAKVPALKEVEKPNPGTDDSAGAKERAEASKDLPDGKASIFN